MSAAIFEVDGDRAVGSFRAAGPWDPGLMHGGAPSSLIAWAAERVETPAPMRISRLTIDLLRPVPVGELLIEGQVIRQGRKIQLCQIRLLAGGVEVTRAMVLKVRTAQITETHLAPLDQPGPLDCPPAPRAREGDTTFNANFDMRSVSGGFREHGPGVVWFRLERPMIGGQANSPAMIAGAVADFTNGISSVMPFERFTFINGDLTVNLARQPVGEWVLSNAESWIAADGGGLAMTRLADLHGYFGTATQNLVIEAR